MFMPKPIQSAECFGGAIFLGGGVRLAAPETRKPGEPAARIGFADSAAQIIKKAGRVADSSAEPPYPRSGKAASQIL